MEVIYTGLRQTPEMVVNASLQEDVQVIGLSILSGAAHNAIVRRDDLLKPKIKDDRAVLSAGIIPVGYRGLKKSASPGIFQPGTPMDRHRKFHPRARNSHAPVPAFSPAARPTAGDPTNSFVTQSIQTASIIVPGYVFPQSTLRSL